MSLLSEEKKLQLAKALYGAPLHTCIDTIEAAVLEAQGKQKPVAWIVYLPSIQTQHVYDDQDDPGYVDDLTNHDDEEVTPLYAAPVVQPAELNAEYTRGRNDGWEAAEMKYKPVVQPDMPWKDALGCGLLRDLIHLSRMNWNQDGPQADRDAFNYAVKRLEEMIAAAEGKE